MSTRESLPMTMTSSSVTTRYTISSENQLAKLSTKEKSKYFSFCNSRIPYPIDCQDVPEHLKEEYPTYQDYLNSLGQHTYFIMGNGPV